MDIYQPDKWHDFFVLTGGAAATLAGLVFVAMSLNVKLLSKDLTQRSRAIGTLSGLISVFVLCDFSVIANQNRITLGVAWLFIALVDTGIYVDRFSKAIKLGSSTLGLRTTRIVLLMLCCAGQIAGAIILIAGHIAGLYLAAISLLINLAFMISGAWLLFIGASEDAEQDG